MSCVCSSRLHSCSWRHRWQSVCSMILMIAVLIHQRISGFQHRQTSAKSIDRRSIHHLVSYRNEGSSGSSNHGMGMRMSLTVDARMQTCSFKLLTFNILAPCYKRIKHHDVSTTATGSGKNYIMEAEREDMYIERNRRIIEELQRSEADIICLQEFWSGSPQLQELYMSTLCGDDGDYLMHVLPRTSCWRSRGDSIAMLVRKGTGEEQPRLHVEDVREILFHDCGDRVALMMLLALEVAPDMPLQRFICINTHLLFPHNEYSSKIRLREMTKVLGFVEAYRQKELCPEVCSRSDIRLPVIIAGDFNGSPRGTVYQFLKSQNFRSSLHEYCKTKGTADDCSICPPADTDEDNLQLSKASATWDRWVSHKSHRGEDVPVDHIVFLNPSEQTEEKLPSLIPDWTDLVFRELMQRIIAERGSASAREIFSSFDQDSSNYVDKEEFRAALQNLGFIGEGTPCLTDEEIDILVESADSNDDGQIDYKEFYDRFWQSSALEESTVSERQLAASIVVDESLSTATDDANSDEKGRAQLRKIYARSSWLSQKISSSRGKEQNSNADSARLVVTNPVVPVVQLLIEEKGEITVLEPASPEIALEEMEAEGTREEAIMTTRDAALKTTIQEMLPDTAPAIVPLIPLSKRTNAVPMRDLSVSKVRILPEEMEQGIWPSDYDLSDHGIVECVFTAEINHRDIGSKEVAATSEND